MSDGGDPVGVVEAEAPASAQTGAVDGQGQEPYSGPLKLVHEKLEFNLRNQTIKIGRNAQNDVQLPDQLVSGSHAMIRNGKLIDKGSTNGTFVNGQEVPKNQYWALRPNDDITFGDTTLKVLAGYPYKNEEDGQAGTTQIIDDDSSSGDNDSGDEDAAPPGLVHSKGVLKHGATKHWVHDVNPGAAPTVDPTGRPANDVNHQVRVLQKQVDTLRFENQKLKGQLNPQRQRQIKKREQEAQKALHSQIRNLEFQIMYGEEKAEDINKELQEEVDLLKQENQAAKKVQDELSRLRQRYQDRTEECEALKESEKKSNERLSELTKQLQRAGNKAGAGGAGGAVNVGPLLDEVRGMRESLQKLYVVVFLIISICVLAACGYFAVGGGSNSLNNFRV